MKKYWLSFVAFLCCIGIIAAGFVLKSEPLVVIALICATFNASIFSACVSTTTETVRRHIVIEEKEVSGNGDSC